MRVAVWSTVLAALHTLTLAASPTTAPPADDGSYDYTVVPRDTVIGLARRLLADPTRWKELSRLNRLPNPNRIYPGQVLRIPLRMMTTEMLTAGVLSVIGDVRSGGGAPLERGQGLPEGGEVRTGADGHVTLRLADGSVLRLRPDSRLQLRESRRVPQAQVLRSGARLEQGRVEIEAAPAPAGKPGFRIETPQGVLGVRGTEFRVAADAQAGITRGEVLGGAVQFEGQGGASQQRVGAGFGAVIGGAGRVAAPVKLLLAPEVSGLPALQERIVARFALPPLDGAQGYRAQVSQDGRFDRVVADLTSATPELRFGDLPDGDYVLRVRGLDASGIEGTDADWRFKLKARPEPPLPIAPTPRAVSFGERVDFAWTGNVQAQAYRLQLSFAADAAFAEPLHELKDLPDTQTVIEGLLPGRYHWRLASVRLQGGTVDRGPWGDPQGFEVRPPPPKPKPPVVGDRSVAFAWDGQPGQAFQFQVARDEAFTQGVFDEWLTQPSLDLPLPGTGRFFVRLRVRDPDGFEGPFTTPQFFDVPHCARDSSGACVRSTGGGPWIVRD